MVRCKEPQLIRKYYAARGDIFVPSPANEVYINGSLKFWPNLPSSITKLSFGATFNPTLFRAECAFSNLSQLKVLHMGCNFNIQICPKHNLPESLEELRFPSSYDNPVCCLPPNLTCLVMGRHFRPTKLPIFPPSLTWLWLPDVFFYENFSSFLPSSLTRLRIGKEQLPGHIKWSLLPNLTRFSSFHVEEKLEEAKSVLHLKIKTDSSICVQRLPPYLQILKISPEHRIMMHIVPFSLTRIFLYRPGQVDIGPLNRNHLSAHNDWGVVWLSTVMKKTLELLRTASETLEQLKKQKKETQEKDH